MKHEGKSLISRADSRKMFLTPKKKPQEERNGHFLLWMLYLDVMPGMAVAILLRIKPIWACRVKGCREPKVLDGTAEPPNQPPLKAAFLLDFLL